MNIIVTNEWNNLKVYHYQDGETDPELQNIRGIIKDGDKVVCKSFGYTPEVLINDFQSLNDVISPLINGETKFYKAYEGTVLRLWQYDGLWHLSTHRKINAFLSKWGSNSNYGELFCRALAPLNVEVQDEDILKSYTKRLNPEKIYCFLLRSFKENRKVCKCGADPSLYIIGSFDRSKDFAFCTQNEETGFPEPEQIADIADGDALMKHVNELDPLEYQGVIIMNPDGKSAKVVNLQYDYYDKLRGNVPNVLHRYVQLRWTDKLEEFKNLYPEHKEIFDKWESVMNSVVHNIMRKYIERYINHRMAILPPEQYDVMIELQDLFMTKLKPKRERATVKHIWEILGRWTERDVNVLYKKYNERQAVTGNGNHMPDNERTGITNFVTTNKNTGKGAVRPRKSKKVETQPEEVLVVDDNKPIDQNYIDQLQKWANNVTIQNAKNDIKDENNSN